MTIKTAYPAGEPCWVDFTAHDMEAAISFYGALFGWTHHMQDTYGGPPYGQFCKDGHVVAGIGQMGDEMKAQGVPPTWNTYVAVERCEAVEQACLRLGGQAMVPTMKVLEAGHLAFLRDPAGAVFATWQAGEHIGAELVNAPGSFCWSELATPDLDAARAFYAELFGWTCREEDGPAPTKVAMIENQGREVGHMLQMTEAWAGIPPNWMVYFAVADTDASVKQVEALGGKVLVPPMDIPPGRFSVIQDPQGAVLTIIRLSEPPE